MSQAQSKNDIYGVIDIIKSQNCKFKFSSYKDENLEVNNNDNIINDIIQDKAIEYPSLDTKYIKSFDQFLDNIYEFSKKPQNNNCEIWFRGVCNKKYKLLPSLYVNLPNQHTNPYKYQIALLRQCYINTKKFYSIFAQNEQPKAALQSLMQHYGVPTNLLDFSTDPLSSLYWALNPENENDKNHEATAVVYMFNPHLYQKACNFISKKLGTNNNLFQDIYGIYSHNCLNNQYIIEKTSDEDVTNRTNPYEQEINEYENSKNDNEKKKKMLYKKLPVPIVIPQKNDRIIAQSGTFVAFNFFHIPIKSLYQEKCPSAMFNYISLADIQEEYARLCDKFHEKKEYLFLSRIMINPYCTKNINERLKNTFKYSVESVYPDLPNLLKNVKRDMYGY